MIVCNQVAVVVQQAIVGPGPGCPRNIPPDPLFTYPGVGILQCATWTERANLCGSYVCFLLCLWFYFCVYLVLLLFSSSNGHRYVL